MQWAAPLFLARLSVCWGQIFKCSLSTSVSKGTQCPTLSKAAGGHVETWVLLQTPQLWTCSRTRQSPLARAELQFQQKLASVLVLALRQPAVWLLPLPDGSWTLRLQPEPAGASSGAQGALKAPLKHAWFGSAPSSETRFCQEDSWPGLALLFSWFSWGQ